MASEPADLALSPRTSDPYLRANTSLRNRGGRVLWHVVYWLLFRWSPRPLHVWRAFLLRAFGARIGKDVHIYPRARIWAPWNLVCEDVVAIANDAIVYNPAVVRLCSHSIVSEQAYLCGASHDYNDPAFPMISAPITLERYAWVCARASVLMGVTVREGAILGLGSVATADLEPWSIYAGVPARRVKARPKLH